MNVIMPFFAVYNVSYASDTIKSVDNLDASASFFNSEKILICTQEGFKWVSLTDAQDKGGENTTSYQCALCYLSAQGVQYFTPLNYITVLVDQPLEKVFHYRVQTPVDITSFFLTSPTRAPPFIA